MLVINDIITTSRKINTFTGKKDNAGYTESENKKSGTNVLPVMTGLIALGAVCYAAHNLKNTHSPAKIQIIKSPHFKQNTKDGGVHTFDFTGPNVFDMSKIKNNYNISNSWKKYRTDIEERTKKFSTLFGIEPEKNYKHAI